MSGRPAGLARGRGEQPRMAPRLALTAVPLALALALAACGASTTKTVTTAVHTASASTTSTPSSTHTSTTANATTATTATSAASGPPPCTAAMLTGAELGQQGAAGHGLLGFALRNTSGHSCHTYGYPGVRFLAANGAPLPTVSTRTTHDLLGAVPRVALTLAPGEQASFRLVVDHGVRPGEHCVLAHALQVIPPDDTATRRIAITDGAYECGTATVTPLRPGTTALVRRTRIA